MFFDLGLKSKLKNVTVLFGGRGIGKTYSALYHEITEKSADSKFIWLRDTERVCEVIMSGESLTAPIKKDHLDFPYVEILRDGKLNKFYASDTADFEERKEIGYLMALSTFKNSRGVDFSTTDIIYFDEFIPEVESVQKYDTGTLFLNAYETVNRNRELFGQDPVKIVMMTNTNNIYSPVLKALGLSDIVEDMVEKGQKVFDSADVHIEFIESKEFTEKKSKTLIYRLTEDQTFKDSALNNQFTESRAMIKHYKLVGFTPVLQVNNQYVLLFRESDGIMYWKKGCYKNVQNYDMNNSQQALYFRYAFADQLRKYYIANHMHFDSLYTQRDILNFAKINGR